MKKVKHRKTILIISGVILAIVLCIGGIYTQIENHQREEKMEMIKFAKDHEKEMNEEVCYGDKAHHIKSITYEWNRTEENPMGGFNVYGYVNHDKKLNIALIIGEENGKFDCRLASSAPIIGDWKGID